MAKTSENPTLFETTVARAHETFKGDRNMWPTSWNEELLEAVRK